ncbi:MAG: GNAT family N-acetyltransferase [Nitrospina sp.]|nr:GNAT family N-acetyltransferase [Nitrospina sp.]
MYSLFQEPWWLEAVAPNDWGRIEIKKNDALVATLPYVICKKYGIRMITMPPLTQTLGPWFQIRKQKNTTILSEQKELMTELIEKLPTHDYFLQNFHSSITNWLPFYWKGFKQTTRYSYILTDLSDLDKIWNNTSSKIKTHIRKARDRYHLKIRTDIDVERFLDINEMTYKRQNKKVPYSKDLVKRLDAACEERNSRKIFFAEDNNGTIHAAVYLVWDNNSAYYIMGGSDPALRNSGAVCLALWEAIQFAATVTKQFDFEGSMVEPIELFFRAFGGKQVPYFRVTRATNLPIKIGEAALQTLRFIQKRY